MARKPVAVIQGGGDLGSGCALRLFRTGFDVLMLEQEQPTAVRRTVSFSEAVYAGRCRVEEVEGVLAQHADDIRETWALGKVPIAIDPNSTLVDVMGAEVRIDARLAKGHQEALIRSGGATIALGPGYVAGDHVDAVIETNRGPDLGRVIWQGTAEANTSIPAPIGGHSAERVLRSPANGAIEVVREIGQFVERGDVIASVSGKNVVAPFRGLLRGLIHPGIEVKVEMKIGDIDPRLAPNLCFQVSDKALAISGGALEASIILLRRMVKGFRLDIES